jgi:hypothetical protein
MPTATSTTSVSTFCIVPPTSSVTFSEPSAFVS